MEDRISQESRYLVVLTDRQSLPIMVAERLLQFGYQMVQLRSPVDVLNLPSDRDLLKLTIVDIHEDIDWDKVIDLVKAIQVVQPEMKFLAAVHNGQEIDEQLIQSTSSLEVIHYPFEQDQLINSILELSPIHIARERLNLDTVAEVQLPALKDIDVLPFDVFLFLPLNQRAIAYKKAGQQGFYADLSRLASQKNVTLYVRRSDFPVYSKYMAKYVSSVESEDQLSEEVRQQVIRNRFSQVMRSFVSNEDFHDEAKSRDALATARKITLDFVKAEAEDPVWTDRIRMLVGRELTNSVHALNTSAYCVMFGLICGLDDINTLSLGGMFHDIGMSAIPPEIAKKKVEDMADEERAMWEDHPAIGLEILEKKGFQLPYEVKQMILQHHNVGTQELVFEGSDAIRYAGICAFADHFDELTSTQQGHERMSPERAIMEIAGLNGRPAQPFFDLSVHQPILDLFLVEHVELEEDKDEAKEV